MGEVQNCHVWLPGGKAGMTLMTSTWTNARETGARKIAARHLELRSWIHVKMVVSWNRVPPSHHPFIEGFSMKYTIHFGVPPWPQINLRVSAMPPFPISQGCTPGTIRRDCCWTLQVPAASHAVLPNLSKVYSAWLRVRWSNCHVCFGESCFCLLDPNLLMSKSWSLLSLALILAL